MMMQEIQGIQDRHGGRMEENERRVAQVLGSEAREKLCKRIKYIFKQEKKKECS